MQLVVRLIYAYIIEKAIVPKAFTEVVELLVSVDDRYKSGHVIVRAVAILAILTYRQELRQLCAFEVTSEILTQRFKERGNVLMIEAREITKVLILGNIGIINNRKVIHIKMVMWKVFGIVCKSEEMFTPSVLLIHCKVIGKAAHVVLIPAEVTTFSAHSTGYVYVLTALTSRVVRVGYLSRTEAH